MSTGLYKVCKRIYISLILLTQTVSDSDLELPSRRKVGKGGVALFWRRTLESRVAILNIDDDRLVGIQYQVSHDSYIYIVQTYLPSANHPISELNDYLLKLQDVCSIYSSRAG